MGRLLTERKALLIEVMEDTTQPDPERRAGLMEFLVIASVFRKLRIQGLTWTVADLLQRRR